MGQGPALPLLRAWTLRTSAACSRPTPAGPTANVTALEHAVSTSPAPSATRNLAWALPATWPTRVTEAGPAPTTARSPAAPTCAMPPASTAGLTAPTTATASLATTARQVDVRPRSRTARPVALPTSARAVCAWTASAAAPPAPVLAAPATSLGTRAPAGTTPPAQTPRTAAAPATCVTEPVPAQRRRTTLTPKTSATRIPRHPAGKTACVTALEPVATGPTAPSATPPTAWTVTPQPWPTPATAPARVVTPGPRTVAPSCARVGCASRAVPRTRTASPVATATAAECVRRSFPRASHAPLATSALAASVPTASAATRPARGFAGPVTRRARRAPAPLTPTAPTLRVSAASARPATAAEAAPLLWTARIRKTTACARHLRL